MNEESIICEDSGKTICNNRREFFVKASTIAGGLILSLSGLKDAGSAQTTKGDKSADGKDQTKDQTTDEAVLKVDEKSPLNKVGGFDVIETKAAGRVIIVRTADMGFSAYSARCTHKGGKIKYDEKTGQLFCPSHGSRFDLQGQVVKGPATKPLQTFAAQNEIVVTLKPKA